MSVVATVFVVVVAVAVGKQPCVADDNHLVSPMFDDVPMKA